ncbi:hypothetical protein LCGC14_0848240 [marine sediment metagenome]|uniref:Bacterial type II secretion system protein E domain-containing protein n=1 Tax=marine sediment metagenome TaxID=412755 RepID=A0A0F9SI60_9ZZZZ
MAELTKEQAKTELDRLLKEMVSKGGSDLHLKVGQPPIVRVNGSLVKLEETQLTAESVKNLTTSILTREQVSEFEQEKELDMAYSIPGTARFRVNYFNQIGFTGAVYRAIPFEIKSADELGLPESILKFCNLPRGLVLVTGPTGSGKSTTLAALIDQINSDSRRHIITVEDPIEFLHNDKKSAINQRELGGDTNSFADALKHVLRQNPDVILVGELRDLETMSLAITAAETGSLVFATLHTIDAAQTIDRMIDVFPPDQQDQVRMQLSTCLQAVVSQTLVPLKTNEGRVVATEVLVANSGVRNAIRSGKTHQVYSLIQTGAADGMKLLDKSLEALVEQGLVTYEQALAKSSNPSEFKQGVAL